MPKGEAVRTIDYNPGEAPTRSEPVEEGNYELKLKSKGKPGPKGWRKKSPKSFPNRMLVFSILDTEDEITGKEKEVVEFASLSPGFSLQKLAYLAYAAGYPKKLKLVVGPKKKPNDVSVMQNMKAVDEMLQFVEDEEVTLRAFLGADSYNGEDRNKVGKWLSPDAEVERPADEDDESEESEDESEETEETDESEAEESDESDDSEEAEEAEESEDEEADEEQEDEAEEAEESDEGEEEPEEKPKKKKGAELDSPAVKKAKAKHAAAKTKTKKKSKK